MTCSECRNSLESVQVVRRLRKHVNFTSPLPRRGYAVICPICKTGDPGRHRRTRTIVG